MRILRPNLLLVLALPLALGACGSMSNYVPPFIKPYKFDIQQGNFITQEDTAKVRLGMSKDEVRFVLGTPLLNDAFHADRWDYLFRLLKADGQVLDARYTVTFKDGKVDKFGGEGLPLNQAEANLAGQTDPRSRRPIEPTAKSKTAAEPKAQPAEPEKVPEATQPAKSPSATIKRKVQPTPRSTGNTGSDIGGTETAPELK